MTYDCTALVPVSGSTKLPPSKKHSIITGDYANCRIYFSESFFKIFPVKKYLQGNKGFDAGVLILESTSLLSFDWNLFLTNIYIYIYTLLKCPVHEWTKRISRIQLNVIEKEKKAIC